MGGNKPYANQNLLTGKIPTDFSQLTALTSLFLEDNKLSGQMPPGLTKLTGLQISPRHRCPHTHNHIASQENPR
jgi:hypothetical protein